MKKIKDSKGFSAVEALLVVVVLVLLSGAGWYVWSSRQNNTTAKHKPESVAASENISVKDITNTSKELPEGWTWYENSEHKFKLAYPAKWGEPRFGTSNGSAGTAYFTDWFRRDEYNFRFDITMQSEDYVGEGCNDASGCKPVPASITKAEYTSFIEGIKKGENFSAPNQDMALLDYDDSHYSVLTTSDGTIDHHIELQRIVSVPSLKSSAALGSYWLYRPSSSCLRGKVSPQSAEFCITQDVVDSVDAVMRSIGPL